MKKGDKVICITPCLELTNCLEYLVEDYNPDTKEVLIYNDFEKEEWYLAARFFIVKGKVRCNETNTFGFTIGKEYLLVSEYSIQGKPMMGVVNDYYTLVSTFPERFTKL